MSSNKTDGLKRKRDPTFVSSEKMALVELVEKHFATVESKKTDSFSVKNKTLEWKKIAEEFNAVSPIHPRDWSVLKNCWENMKKKAKSEQTARNQHYLGTGGGPPRKTNPDPAIERVLELIQSRVSGYVNLYDSDGTHILASGSNASVTQQATQEYILCSNDASTSKSQVQDTNRETTEATEMADTLTVDWSQYTPSMLREPISSALLISRSPSPEASETRLEPPPQHQRASTTSPGASISTEHAIPATLSTSRRRPILRRNRVTTKNESLNAQRINTLLKTDAQAEEEHAMNMNILRLQEQREREILKQEKLKTTQEEIKLEILKLQLKKLQD